ncbi:MAG TPA: VCBS repeat-containing protein [Nitrososphaeraceae archaeon]|nr:VCBS repeat-containing protein [Nitrososphaeraceae archaeon]
MYKSWVFTFGLLTSLFMIITATFANLNILPNPAMAQGYDNYDDNKYSQYPTKENKYECRTGPFEGFFVSSVEFCKHVKFDDRKDHKDRDRDNKTGTQGPPGPQGPPGIPGLQGAPGTNGTNGINGTNGVNGTEIDSCVACLLDALVKLDSGAILVNVTINLERGVQGPSGDVNVTLPLVIDVDVATLLQQQIAESLELDANATIFEICAAIDVQEDSIDFVAVLNGLEDTLVPIVTAQISQLVNQIAIAISNITGEPIDQALIDEILASIDIDDIVAQITANVQVSLEILETCLDLTPIPPPPLTTETLTVIKNIGDCQADAQTCQRNPIQPSNFTVVIEGNNPSQNNFPGSSGTGTNVELELGPYNVTEQGLDPVTPAICSTLQFEAGRVVSPDSSGLFICTNFSDECEGDITIGNPQTCTIENVLVKLNFLDLAVANSGSASVSILLGNGNGTFVTPALNFGAGDGPVSVAVGDFNNDTNLDLAIANRESDNVSILLGNGNGTFVTPALNFGAGDGPFSVAVGDFNNDTNLDLATANFFSNDVSILLGNGNGTFVTPALNFGAGFRPFSVAVGDFNNDTILDLAIANLLSDNVSILLGNGNGTFVTPALNFGAGDGPRSVAVGDFN